MNYKILGKILGKIMILEGALMLAPLVISLIYKEPFLNTLAFIVPVLLLFALGFLLQLLKPERNSFYQKEGFALTALAWVIMALFGAIPFMINREIPRFEDAFFEIMSGFTTTGASVVDDLTLLSHSTLFWRSFSHWIGGMGILVFVLIFIPESNEGSAMHLLRAESPGPQVGKIVSKMKVTTRILYLIYLGLTVLEVIVLMFDKPIAGYENDQLFISLLTAFGSAGTGGFGIIPGSLELYNPFSQYVVSIFLLLYGVNFALYYLLLIGKARDFFRSEEFKGYLAIVAGAILLIFASLAARFEAYPQDYTTEEMFRHSLFQVSSLITTTGYSTTDFNLWPTAACAVLLCLMFFGATAGSTAGGIKLSRIMIAIKGIYINIRKLINPRYVPKMKFEGKTLDERTTNDVFAFISLYFLLMIAVTLILSIDPINGQTITISSDGGTYTQTHGLLSNITTAISCLSNIGPGFEGVGAYASFSGFSAFSKIILSFTMLAGRLEILPVIILFNKKAWKRF